MKGLTFVGLITLLALPIYEEPYGDDDGRSRYPFKVLPTQTFGHVAHPLSHVWVREVEILSICCKMYVEERERC